ncbi:MBG domain-containing protein, partial [Lactiplantibacillus daoliensis]
MRQKVANQNIKKNFILYKGHTGWKVKTRIFGTLLVGLSAMTIAESTGAINAHADTGTGTPSADTASQSSTPKMAGTTTLKTGTNDATTSASASEDQEQAGQEQVKQDTVTQTYVAKQSDTPAPVSAEPESLSVNDPTTTTTNDATTDGQYQTLTPDQPVQVGKTDGSGVTLSGSQVQDHFTNTVQNFNKNGDAGYLPKNKTTQPADENGVWQLTVNGGHDYTSDTMTDYTMHNIDGPQTAHVSFENDIDFGHDFTLTGALGIGTKTSGGADGVGIVFAPGDPEYATTGLTGGNLGVGGLKNAFAFVYDDHYNGGDDTSGVVDPGNSAYFGWRSTDANGVIQKVTDATAWKAASAFDLSNRGTDPLVDFTMSYNYLTKMLSVTIQNQTFTRSLADIDTSKGYSISIAASTGQDTNNYSAKIDSFTYTPKTASVNVKVATAAGDVSTTTPVTANIGDTIYVFSTKAAAERAVAADPTLDPSLVTVIPASTTNNVYLVDGDNTAASNGTVHYAAGDSSIADAAYYSYKVTGDASQTFNVPVSQAFTAEVTPVDSVTGDAIPGMDPIQVTTVAGKSVVIQVPGYTPVTVVLDAPAAGETVAQDKVKINTGTTPSTETDVANPIEHYYTAAGETIDGTKVTANATVGTNQSVTDALNATPIGEDGKVITDGSTPAYTWSTVPNASATDSTDSTTPQDSKSILVPTKATLDEWLQKATDNQAQADTSKKQAQDIYDKFVGLTGITQEQKDAAKKLLDSVNDMYDQISTNNAAAKADLQAAEDSTDPETIFKEGQAGYGALADVDNTMTTFQKELDNLTSTNSAAVASLATFVSWSRDYGQDIGFPVPAFGDGFGATPTAAQKAGFDNPDYYYYVNAADSDTHVTPKDAGTYYFKLTDAGRTYLKSLTTNTNAGLYTSAALTINPVDAKPTITNTSLQYGGVDGKLAGVTYDLGTVAGDDDPRLNLTQDDFEIDDVDGNQVAVKDLQAGGTYTIRYSDAAQTALKTDGNYNFTDFGTATLTVTPRGVTLVAADAGKTYGDSTDPALSLKGDPDQALVNGDTVSSLGVNLTRATGKDAGTYAIKGTATGNKNYKVTITDGTFTIDPKAITVQANNVSVDYDGKAHQVDQSGFTIADGDQLATGDTAANLAVTLTPTAETDADTYTISGSSTAKNYKVTVLDGTLTINQKAATVTADAATVGYGDALPTFTVTDSDTGLKTTLDNTDFEIFDNNAKPVVTGPLQAGGDYTIQLTQKAQDNLKTDNPNYKLSFDANKLTVAQREITVHIEDGGKDYGVTNDPALKFTIPATTATGKANGTLVDSDTQDNLGVTLTRETGDNAGTYKITGTAANDGNYNVSIENDGTFTIAQAAGTATVAATSVVYGDNLSSIEVTVNGTTSELDANNFEIVDAEGAVVTAGQLQAGDSYTLQLTDTAKDTLKKANPNYTLNFVAGGLTVTQRPITVQIDNISNVYGQSDPDLTFSIPATTKDGQANGTLVGQDTQDKLGVTLTREPGTDAKAYVISGTAADNTNYAVTIEDGTFTITPAHGGVTIENAKATYGDTSSLQLSAVLGMPTKSEISQNDFEIVNAKGDVFTLDQLPAGNYTIQLNQAAKTRLAQENSNYDFTNPDHTSSFGTGTLTVDPRPVKIQISNRETYAGVANPENVAALTSDSGTLKNGDTLDDLKLTYEEPTNPVVGTYTIDAESANVNYAVKVLPGQLTVLGQDTDSHGTTTTTEKDSNGNVVKIDKQWPDNSHTIYTYDPATGDRTVTEQKDGQTLDQQTLGTDPVTLADGDNTSTTVVLDPTTKQPIFEHDTTETNANGDTTTTKDAEGNVVKVVKKWPDDSQTTYTYDPIGGTQTVTEQKDGQTVDNKTITAKAPEATLSSGDGVKTIVDAPEPGAEPTFKHDTTKTDGDTTTTTDANGNVIKVVKQWP